MGNVCAICGVRLAADLQRMLTYLDVLAADPAEKVPFGALMLARRSSSASC